MVGLHVSVYVDWRHEVKRNVIRPTGRQGDAIINNKNGWDGKGEANNPSLLYSPRLCVWLSIDFPYIIVSTMTSCAQQGYGPGTAEYRNLLSLMMHLKSSSGTKFQQQSAKRDLSLRATFICTKKQKQSICEHKSKTDPWKMDVYRNRKKQRFKNKSCENDLQPSSHKNRRRRSAGKNVAPVAIC
ncbi:hypothetical protein L5515_015684 [Caenorhabditis briggsae]|uniref:Uncharacterized protein n=1 Tax=Caenorhabditis briggsae TaxID=6238 RepID=A0AAE9ECD3_CAEBR|nr:hypothetical protein L5515_015684 [Caenorhabditis briggsae]